MKEMILKHSNDSDTWYYTKLIYQQWEGLQMGYEWVEDATVSV